MNRRQVLVGIILVMLIVSIVYFALQYNQGDTTPPVVTIINPQDDGDLYGSVIISFNATDENLILGYEIRIDSIIRANESSYEWDTTTETDGTHSILCRAMDNSSNWGESSISVVVNNTAHPNLAPVVTITAPSADSTVSDYTQISTTVVDEDSLNARIYVDNERLSSTGAFLWNSKLWSNGLHTIIANVTDSGGLTGSDSIQVIVNNSIVQLSFDGELKIMAYNIEQSGIDPDWMNVVKEENADIMILVETGTWEDNSDLILRNSIEELNDYFVDEAPYSGYTAQSITYSTSGEAILSRFPILEFNQIGIVPLDDATAYDVTHDFIHAIVNINGTNVHLIGCHLKAMDGETNEQRREWETEGIINYMDNLGNVPILYLGDLNSFSPFDTGDLAPMGDGLGYGPLTMMLVPDDPTYGQYASEIHNFTDVFRTLNPADPGYTGFGSRIDYIIVNDYFVSKLINSTTGDTAHADTGSDHYSVDVFLGWNSTGSNDTIAPANVTGLKIDANYTTGIDLSWNANNETDLSRYFVYRDSLKIAEVGTSFYNDSGLSTNTTYVYEVSAIDIHGNEGNKSLAVNATTLIPGSEELIVLNEFLPDPDILYSVEWIELFNPSVDDIDLAGYILDDIVGGGTAPYTIPSDTVIVAGGFLVFNQTTTGIALNNAGDTLHLIKPDGVTVQDYYIYGSGSVDNDVSIGRETDGASTWVIQSTPTPGSSNFGGTLHRIPEPPSIGYFFDIVYIFKRW